MAGSEAGEAARRGGGGCGDPLCTAAGSASLTVCRLVPGGGACLCTRTLGHSDTHVCSRTHTHGEGAGVDLVPGAGASTVAQQGRVCGIFLASSSVLPQTHLPTINYITQSSN